MSLNQLRVVHSKNDISNNDEIENVFDSVSDLYGDKKRNIGFGSPEVIGYEFPIIENSMCFPEDTVKEDKPEEEKTVIAYFKQHKIQELFHILLTHILINMPDDPVEYLMRLLERFNLYVSGEIQEPPLIFKKKHIDSIFRAMDIFDVGTITVKQYSTGLKTMGIISEEIPVCNKGGLVTKEEFLKIAYSEQLAMINELVMLKMWWDLNQEDEKQIEVFTRHLLNSKPYENNDNA